MGKSSPLKTPPIWYLLMGLIYMLVLDSMIDAEELETTIAFFGSRDSRLNLLVQLLNVHHLAKHLLHIQCSFIPKASGLLGEKSKDFLSASNLRLCMALLDQIIIS